MVTGRVQNDLESTVKPSSFWPIAMYLKFVIYRKGKDIMS